MNTLPEGMMMATAVRKDTGAKVVDIGIMYPGKAEEWIHDIATEINISPDLLTITHSVPSYDDVMKEIDDAGCTSVDEWLANPYTGK